MPVWKRLAKAARGAAWRGLTIVDRAFGAGRDDLVPPAHLRLYYYRSAKPEAFARACRDVRTELISRGLRPEHRVLDIGSGIGNLPLGLADYLRGGYDGIEIHPEAVEWCQRAITPRFPSFRFHRADLSSVAYNPAGRQSAAGYRFPFPDRSFDVVFLGSVFTHLLPPDLEQYLREIGRLLAPDGLCVASYFLLNDETRPGVLARRSFISFEVEHASGVCRLHRADTPESAVAFDERYVRRLNDASGLRITDVRRGNWWNGRSHDQDVVTAVKE